MREFILEGKVFNARVLREYSLDSMVVRLFPVSIDHSPTVKVGDIVELASFQFRVYWMRRESDDRGGYLATALLLVGK